MLRIFAIFFIFFRFSKSENFLDFGPEKFYAEAKNFLWCKFCQNFQRQNETGAVESLKLLENLNQIFDKKPFDGFPKDLRPPSNQAPSSNQAPPQNSAPWKIGEILNIREFVLRRFAKGKSQKSTNFENRAEILEFCFSFKCIF